MKKIIIYILLGIVVSSCGNSYEEQKRISRAERARLHREDSLALKLAVIPTLDCLPLFVAKDCQLYDTARLDLRLKFFTAQMDCDTALIGKTVEGVVSDLVRMERLKSEGMDISYLTSTNAYWQLFTNKKARINKVEQLGDKMVAMTRFSATDRLTDSALDGVKTSSIVFRIQVNDVNVRLAMLLNNEMDAAWLTEPQATLARLSNNPVVYDSQDKGRKLGVVAFRKETMADERRQRQIAELSKSYDIACDSLNKRGLVNYSGILHKYYRLTDEEIKALPKIKFYHVEPPRKADLNFANITK